MTIRQIPSIQSHAKFFPSRENRRLNQAIDAYNSATPPQKTSTYRRLLQQIISYKNSHPGRAEELDALVIQLNAKHPSSPSLQIGDSLDYPTYPKPVWDLALNTSQAMPLTGIELENFKKIIPPRPTPPKPLPQPPDFDKDIHRGRSNFFAKSLGIRPDHHILDVGCRTGHGAYAFSNQAEFVLGVEIDLSELEKARKTFPETDRLQFTSQRLEDLAAVTENKGRFDVITIFLCDSELCNNKSAAKAIFELLKNGGRVVLTSEFTLPKIESPMSNVFSNHIMSNGAFKKEASIVECVNTYETFMQYTLTKSPNYAS